MDEQVMDPFISDLRFVEGARRTTNGRFVTTLPRVLALKLDAIMTYIGMATLNSIPLGGLGEFL